MPWLFRTLERTLSAVLPPFMDATAGTAWRERALFLINLEPGVLLRHFSLFYTEHIPALSPGLDAVEHWVCSEHLNVSLTTFKDLLLVCSLFDGKERDVARLRERVLRPGTPPLSVGKLLAICARAKAAVRFGQERFAKSSFSTSCCRQGFERSTTVDELSAWRAQVVVGIDDLLVGKTTVLRHEGQPYSFRSSFPRAVWLWPHSHHLETPVR